MAATSNTRQRNPRGQGDALRSDLVQSAISRIDETNDVTALTLRGIARQANVSAPAIYHHFATLPMLIDAVLAESFHQLERIVHEAILSESNPVDALTAAGRAYVQFGWQHPARYRLMFAATGYAPDAAQVFTLVEELFQRCVMSGKSASTDPHRDTFLLWVAFHGMATLEKPGRSDYLRLGPLDRLQLVETTVERLACLHP
jgi:AcrR family transcriptional regulator